MIDAYGDGWNGNTWSSGDQSAGLTSGDTGTADFCFDMSAANVYSCGGGSWQSEVSWTLDCTDGTTAAGGAPSDGCLGNCDTVVYGCTDADSCNYNSDATDDDGSCYGPDCAGDCDGGAVVDACGECNGDGSACAGCPYPQWFGDGYCDGSNNIPECNFDAGDCCPGDCVDGTYDCETYGGDCLDCLDPDSADNNEGGECFDMVLGCTDPYADNFDSDANTDDGSCLYDGCAAGSTLGCSDQDIADGDCAADGWIGDGYCDGYEEAYGVNFCCYDNDGGDCTDAECAAPSAWDATITGLTAEGVDYDNYGVPTPAVSWDWDDLSDGTACEDNGQVTCEFDLSCADTAEECPEDPYPDCLGTLSWIGDGYCDSNNNNAECDYDAGDCCPTECADDAANNCPDNPAGCYSNCADGTCCGDCGSCVDPDDADLAEGGACDDYEQWTDDECAASMTVAGSDGVNDCYDDGSGYFVFAWDGGCLATSITYDVDGVETTLDIAAYGFTNGVSFYGFGYEESQTFIVAFTDAMAVAEATTDCSDTTADDGGGDDGGGEECSAYTVDMADAYGDGWNGGVLTIGDESFTIETGSAAQACYDGPGDVAVTCGGGSWDSEISWTISDDSGVVLSGGAPFEGCLGTCDDTADDGGGDDGGGEECVNDDSSEDAYGDTCTSWYDAYEGPGSSGCEGAYNDDDFDASVQCCVCQDAPRQGSNNHFVNVISTNNALNEQVHAGSIATYKKTSFVQPKVEAPIATTIVDIATGEITTIGESNRLVSYTINVSCDACLSGAPWSGSWTAGTSDFLVYGFDDDSSVCATVSGTSTELGSTADSEAACDNAGGEDACEFQDCSGADACGYESWVGDGYCDDGTYGLFFDCEAFDCDAGDCMVICWDGSEACGTTDCPDEPSCEPGDVNGDDSANVQDIVLIVGYILDGEAGFDLGCADANGDGAVNVQDIVVIVNMILGGRSAADATEATLNVTNGSVSVKANGFVGAVQMTLNHGSDFTIELTDKAMIADYRTNGNSTTLIVVAPEGEELFEASGDFTIEEVIVANENSQATIAMPTELTLSKAYPNPFNPSTTFDVYVPVEGAVSLSVYNVMGQLVDVIHSGSMAEGSHSITWNASNMTSGMYFVRAQSTSGISVQKVMLMK
jgi:hypothetical protein